MRVDEGVPGSDVGERLGVDVALDVADRRVENGDARVPQALYVGGCEHFRMTLPRRELLEIERDQPQHVDHGRFTNGVYGDRGVFRQFASKEAKSSLVDIGADQRRSEDTRAAAEHT